MFLAVSVVGVTAVCAEVDKDLALAWWCFCCFCCFCCTVDIDIDIAIILLFVTASYFVHVVVVVVVVVIVRHTLGGHPIERKLVQSHHEKNGCEENVGCSTTTCSTCSTHYIFLLHDHCLSFLFCVYY